METAVRKATRLEYLPPKQKHLTSLKNFTITNPTSTDTIIASLEKRLKERSWIITYKVLVIVHYLMREGNSIEVNECVMKRPSVFDTSRIKNTSSAPASVQNIHLYVAYLNERIVAYRNLKRDYIKDSTPNKDGRLRHLSIPNGLLKETSALQRQIENVLSCKFYLDEKDPAITLFAYRMIIDDLLSLFKAVNEGVINILEHYFEMDKKDAAVALKIYKKFSKQTELTISYLNEARKLKSNLELNIPTVNHAPLSLATALEEYLNDDIPNKNNSNKGQSTGLSQPAQQDTTQSMAISPPQQQQQQQQQFFSQPMQQQPFFTQPIQQQQQQQHIGQPVQQQQTGQPMFNQLTFPPQQVQTNNNAYGQNDPFASFVPQQNTGLPLQSTGSPTNNPFFTMMNQQQQQVHTQTSFSNSPYISFSPQHGYQTMPANSNHNALSRSNTFAVGSNFNSNINRSNTISGGSSTNPFRSSSMGEQHSTGHFQPNSFQSQLSVVKPSPYQLSQPTTSSPTSYSSNPFSPVTPPLTPNRQSMFN